jgi:hypothetical protein
VHLHLELTTNAVGDNSTFVIAGAMVAPDSLLFDVGIDIDLAYNIKTAGGENWLCGFERTSASYRGRLGVIKDDSAMINHCPLTP